MNYQEDTVKEIRADYEARAEKRRGTEAQWGLNHSFVKGEQFVDLARNGEVVGVSRAYLWQEQQVYNHIAPIVEARLGKLSRVNSAVHVRPASGDDGDVKASKLASKIVDGVLSENEFGRLSAEANFWAEVTGNVFFKVMWESAEGSEANEDGAKATRGKVKILVCPPNEIFPDNLKANSVDECMSIIHAKYYDVMAIENAWGVRVLPDEGKEKAGRGDSADNMALVIERYTAPCVKYPNGLLQTVAGEELLYEGELPYVNGANGGRCFPFVRQTASDTLNSFFAQSVVERLIPVQRAYNAVKNRKHEFMARLSAGVYAVEDGSCDVTLLSDEGIMPGQIITYRQGSKPPEILYTGNVPAEFRDEEERLLAEFSSVSGVADFAGSMSYANTTLSGYAISLLVEQDDTRLAITADSIRDANKRIAEMILRLTKQFAGEAEIAKYAGDGGEAEVGAFCASDLGACDIVFASTSPVEESTASRRNTVMELLKLGVLADENGKISNRNRQKLLEMIGFGNWEHMKADEEVHVKRAERENATVGAGAVPDIMEADDHEIHIAEHTVKLASGKLNKKAEEVLSEHVRDHKRMSRMEKSVAMATDLRAKSGGEAVEA